MLSAEERSWNIACVTNWHGLISKNLINRNNDKRTFKTDSREQ